MNPDGSKQSHDFAEDAVAAVEEHEEDKELHESLSLEVFIFKNVHEHFDIRFAHFY